MSDESKIFLASIGRGMTNPHSMFFYDPELLKSVFKISLHGKEIPVNCPNIMFDYLKSCKDHAEDPKNEDTPKVYVTIEDDDRTGLKRILHITGQKHLDKLKKEECYNSLSHSNDDYAMYFSPKLIIYIVNLKQNDNILIGWTAHNLNSVKEFISEYKYTIQ